MNVIYFDGVCNLCHGWVKFVYKNSRKGTFYFSSLQENTSADFVIRNDESEFTSLILKDSKGFSYKSVAVRRTLIKMNFPFRLIGYLSFVLPSTILNWFYNSIAQKRYSFFGKKDLCEMPTELDKEYFLD